MSRHVAGHFASKAICNLGLQHPAGSDIHDMDFTGVQGAPSSRLTKVAGQMGRWPLWGQNDRRTASRTAGPSDHPILTRFSRFVSSRVPSESLQGSLWPKQLG